MTADNWHRSWKAVENVETKLCIRHEVFKLVGRWFDSPRNPCSGGIRVEYSLYFRSLSSTRKDLRTMYSIMEELWAMECRGTHEPHVVELEQAIIHFHSSMIDWTKCIHKIFWLSEMKVSGSSLYSGASTDCHNSETKGCPDWISEASYTFLIKIFTLALCWNSHFSILRFSWDHELVVFDSVRLLQLYKSLSKNAVCAIYLYMRLSALTFLAITTCRTLTYWYSVGTDLSSVDQIVCPKAIRQSFQK
jgi:hypothetical protein